MTDKTFLELKKRGDIIGKEAEQAVKNIERNSKKVF